MVEILGRVRKYRPDVQLVVAYNFDEFLKNCTHEPSLEIVRKALPLKEMDGVTFTGHLSQPKLADLMMHAGILVYPGDVPENYCGILNNACAAGLPAICSDLGGVKELYGHAIHTEPHPVDAQKWAEDILSLLERPGAYADLQRTGLELASVTDFSEIGQEWLDFFSNREISADKGLAARLGR
jgi:glycosyltransferase involved in cell wall biosynthesis